MSRLRIGLFGFGVVGKGLYELLQKNDKVPAIIQKICIKDANKARSIDQDIFTTERNDLLHDPEIDIIVELIDDADAALEITEEAFRFGKPVVSANKKMIAENFALLLEWQEKYQQPFLYEASCCAGIPIIRNLEEYYDNDLLQSIEGIFNGSTNYILSQLHANGSSFDQVLKDAQELGFAESDPSLDIDAIDPKYKLGIIIFHAFGLLLKPEEIFNFGISRVNAFDIDFAKQRGKKIRLLAYCQKVDDKVQAWCVPSFVNEGSILSQTENEFNAVLLKGAFSDEQCLIGKGAGDWPTGSAVLSDISALGYQYKYEYKKHKNQDVNLAFDESQSHEVYVRYHENEAPILNDFESIDEVYKGKDVSYLIGRIKHHQLRKADWLNSKTNNIIFLN